MSGVPSFSLIPQDLGHCPQGSTGCLGLVVPVEESVNDILEAITKLLHHPWVLVHIIPLSSSQGPNKEGSRMGKT